MSDKNYRIISVIGGDFHIWSETGLSKDDAEQKYKELKNMNDDASLEEGPIVMLIEGTIIKSNKNELL